MFIYEGKKLVDNVEVECLNIMFQNTQVPATGNPDICLFASGEGDSREIHVQVSGSDINE